MMQLTSMNCVFTITFCFVDTFDESEIPTTSLLLPKHDRIQPLRCSYPVFFHSSSIPMYDAPVAWGSRTITPMSKYFVPDSTAQDASGCPQSAATGN